MREIDYFSLSRVQREEEIDDDVYTPVTWNCQFRLDFFFFFAYNDSYLTCDY